MERLPFNYLVVPLSAPFPTTTNTVTSFNVDYVIQGPTQVNFSFNSLYFTVNPYKVIIDWGLGAGASTILTLNYNPSSTVMYYNSADAYYVYYPTTLINSITSSATIYFENNMIYKINVGLKVLAANIIDQDLNVLSAQINPKTRQPILNIESSKYSTVYNLIAN